MHALKTNTEKIAIKKATNTGYTSKTSTTKATNSDTDKKNNKVSVKVTAKIDIGFGNRLYIRGDGCGLSWKKGIEMKYIDDNCWQWECKDDGAKTSFEFKVLINDEIWSTGENYIAIDKNNEVYPIF
ncbi:MAG: hypothetical protein LBB16_01850 [Puniceicoccales bacterium]|jgi:3D (Asp-Asp-Asp) domain-containing protein|nr:hypothetical protein [Puniceicoccales bacterium]